MILICLRDCEFTSKLKFKKDLKYDIVNNRYNNEPLRSYEVSENFLSIKEYRKVKLSKIL